MLTCFTSSTTGECDDGEQWDWSDPARGGNWENLQGTKDFLPHRCCPGHTLLAAYSILYQNTWQAVGKIPVDVNSMNIDLMSISGHKIYGPKVNFISTCFPPKPFLPITLLATGSWCFVCEEEAESESGANSEWWWSGALSQYLPKSNACLYNRSEVCAVGQCRPPWLLD